MRLHVNLKLFFCALFLLSRLPTDPLQNAEQPPAVIAIGLLIPLPIGPACQCQWDPKEYMYLCYQAANVFVCLKQQKCNVNNCMGLVPPQ